MRREHSWRYLLEGAEELSTALHNPPPPHEHCKYEASFIAILFIIAEVRSHWDIFRYKQRKVKGATDSWVMHRSLKSYVFWFIVWDLEKVKLRRQEYGSRAWEVAGKMRSEMIVHETVLVGTCIVLLSKSVTLRRASEAHCKLRTSTPEQFQCSMVVKKSWGIGERGRAL